MSGAILNIITILSGIVTVVTGSVTIIGYFQHRSVSQAEVNSQYAQPSQSFTPPLSPYDRLYQASTPPPPQYAQPSQKSTPPPPPQYVQPSQFYNQTVQSNVVPGRKRGLSYPKIALLACIGQVSLFASLICSMILGMTHIPGPTNTPEDNLLVAMLLLLFLVGMVFASIAFGMSVAKAGHLHRWGWLIGLIIGFIGLLILFLPALLPLLFGIMGPRDQKTKNAPVVFSYETNPYETNPYQVNPYKAKIN